jgi:hypothetical protein
MPGPVLGAGGELVVQGAQARFLRGRYLAMNREPVRNEGYFTV